MFQSIKKANSTLKGTSIEIFLIPLTKNDYRETSNSKKTEIIPKKCSLLVENVKSVSHISRLSTAPLQ